VQEGTIRAIRVMLVGATVEGDIFHRSLSVDESSVFEGMSRRVENPVERRADNTAESSSSASSATSKATKKAVETVPLVSSAVPATNGASHP
jgi:cytoskeletal protein CcmA (bactofilin family)